MRELSKDELEIINQERRKAGECEIRQAFSYREETPKMRNKYPGKCYQCGLWVEVGEGHFERHLSGWRVQHANCCLEARKEKKAVTLGILPEMPKFKYYAVIDVGIPGSMPEFFPHEFSAETEADLRNKTYASTGVKAQAVVMCKDQYQIYRSLENQDGYTGVARNRK